MKIDFKIHKKKHMCMLVTILAIFGLSSCNNNSQTDETTTGKNPEKETRKMQVIVDTDANNEVDDQHAMAYLFFNGHHFAVEGVTVNATSSWKGFDVPSTIEGHYDEAKRTMQLCNVWGRFPLLKGAQTSFEEIKDDIDNPEFDGHEAVNFIIEQAMKERDEKLVLIPLGKLTNIALALLKEPAIAENIRVVWLGSNYPEPGEHNQVWDEPSMNYVLNQNVPFDMVTVRYGDPSGTDAVKVTQAQILHRMPGKGPVIDEMITGRHGGEFNNWGDYSAELFGRYDMYGEPKARALFDQAAIAILKNPDWAESYDHPAPINIDGEWVERPDNPRKITIWEWFDIYGIMNDFFITMDDYQLVDKP